MRSDPSSTYPLGEVHLDSLDTDVLGSGGSGSHFDSVCVVVLYVCVTCGGRLMSRREVGM